MLISFCHDCFIENQDGIINFGASAWVIATFKGKIYHNESPFWIVHSRLGTGLFIQYDDFTLRQNSMESSFLLSSNVVVVDGMKVGEDERHECLSVSFMFTNHIKFSKPI